MKTLVYLNKSKIHLHFPPLVQVRLNDLLRALYRHHAPLLLQNSHDHEGLKEYGLSGGYQVGEDRCSAHLKYKQHQLKTSQAVWLVVLAAPLHH